MANIDMAQPACASDRPRAGPAADVTASHEFSALLSTLLLVAAVLAPGDSFAAGRGDGARERRGADRPERLQEMRSQMLEYQRQWRSAPAVDARPLAPGSSSGGATERRLNHDERDQLRRQLRQAPLEDRSRRN